MEKTAQRLLGALVREILTVKDWKNILESGRGLTDSKGLTRKDPFSYPTFYRYFTNGLGYGLGYGFRVLFQA